jgi:lysophospholipase L1-like esterase
VNQPSVTYWQRTPEVAVKLSINSQGIRADREIPLQKPPGVLRIVGLGDSFGMGYEVALEETFWAVAERELQAKGVQAQFVNLSVSGHGTAEELIELREHGLRYNPQVVVVAWGGSDVDDNLRARLFRLDGERLVRDQASYLPGTAAQAFLARFALYRWLSENCQLYSFARETVAGQVKNLLTQIRGGHDSRVLESDTAAASERSNRLAIALLREMERECHERSILFLVLDLPFERDSSFVSSFPVDPVGVDFGLQVIRVAEEFQRYQREELFRKRGHGHYTPRGYELVGRRLAEGVRQRIAASPTP